MYRLSIWLIALAFVFNGAASLATIDLPAASALIAQNQNHDNARTAAPSDHVGNNNVMVAMPDHGQAQGHSHSGLKCCGICNVANVIPDIVAIPVTFSYATVAFRTGQHDLVGHLVALDPGIPKTIV
jgi:hypothetical protein